MRADPLHDRAVRIIQRNPIGLMLTVDAEGAPHGRWMGISTQHGLHTLFALTARHTRKVAHLQANPRVTWVFTSPDFAETVSLIGTARVHDGPMMVRDAWDRLRETGRTFAVGPFSDDANLEMVVIETTVERIEVTCPELDAPTPREVAV